MQSCRIYIVWKWVSYIVFSWICKFLFRSMTMNSCRFMYINNFLDDGIQREISLKSKTDVQSKPCYYSYNHTVRQLICMDQINLRTLTVKFKCWKLILFLKYAIILYNSIKFHFIIWSIMVIFINKKKIGLIIEWKTILNKCLN